MIILSKDQIVMLHDHLIQETGGMLGLRDAGLLDAALHAPFQTYGGAEMYPSIQQKAARLGFGLVKNHAFLDRQRHRRIPSRRGDVVLYGGQRGKYCVPCLAVGDGGIAETGYLPCRRGVGEPDGLRGILPERDRFPV